MFTIYSTPSCTYCKAAKQLLEKKHQTYEEIDVMSSEEGMEVMASIQAKTVPQIFHNNVYVGGFNDLKEYLEVDDEG